MPDLQQPSQEGNVVGPFLLGSVPEGQRTLDTSSIAAEVFVFLVESSRHELALCSSVPGEPSNSQSSAALRVARGTGLERPEPGGEKSCRLAVGSADMLYLASYEMSEYVWKGSGHSVQGKSTGITFCCLRALEICIHSASQRNTNAMRR